MSETRQGFLKRVRARLRLAWLSATAQLLLPYLGSAAVALFAVDRLTAWDGAPLASLLLVAAYALALLVGASLLRISAWDVSRAAERGLEAHDAFTTALEFDDPEDEVHAEIQARANRAAASAVPSDAIPIRAEPTRVRWFAAAAALALLIGLLPPLGGAPALSSNLETVIEAEAEEVERLADAMRDSEVEGAGEIASELDELADELRAAKTAEEALQALDKADARLNARLDPQFLSQKAAVEGLAADLALRPLAPDAPPGAAAQLNKLAESLDELSEPERQAAADRLSELAASQAAGAPALSSRLAEAAAALESGDLSTARQALSDAAASYDETVDSVRSQQAVKETQDALKGAASRCRGEPDGRGEAQSDGRSQSEDRDQDESRSQRQGQGQGAGSSPAGEVAGAAPGQGDAAAQGGPGTVGAGRKKNYGTEVETDVYSPIDRGEVSDRLQVDTEGDGQGEVVGRGEAPSRRGESIVPYAQVLPEYLSEAADSLSSLRLPPSLRGIVQKYFDKLADEAGR